MLPTAETPVAVLSSEAKPTPWQLLSSLLRVAIPLVISNFFFTLQLLIDRLMLSWLGPDALAAAGAAAMVLYVPILLLQYTAGFASTFVAQYAGANRRREIGAVLHQALWFSVCTGLAFVPLSLWSAEVVNWLDHAQHLQRLEAEYLASLCFAVFPMLLTATATAFFAGLGQANVVVATNFAGTVVNAVLDWGLIFGHWGWPRLGIAGAGWATVGGCTTSAVLALVLLYRRRQREECGLGWPRWHGRLFARLMYFGLPNGLQAALDVLAWTSFTVFIGWLGAAELAASMLVFNVNAAFLVPMLGLGQALSVVVGQHLGANRADLAERSVHLGLVLGVGLVTFFGALVALFPQPILALYESHSDPQAWQATAKLVPGLLIFVAVYSFFDSLGILLTFALRGAGDTRFVTLATFVLSVGVMILPVYWICRQPWTDPALGLNWAWTGATAYIVSLAGCFAVRFQWGPWRQMRVIEQTVTVGLPD
jgi:MATE family multidrug resistance protein